MRRLALEPDTARTDVGSFAAGVGVKWTLELVGSRSGMFRSNDKWVSNCFPDNSSRQLIWAQPLQTLARGPRVNPRVSAHPKIDCTRKLAVHLFHSGAQVQGQRGRGPHGRPEGGSREAPASWPSPDLSATLTAVCSYVQLSYHPLAVAGQPLTFSLLLTPSNPSGLSTLTTPERTSPKLIVMFSRRVRTTPIDDPSKGRNCDWAGLRVAGATGDDVVEARNGQFEWKGQVDIPKEERTVQSKGVGVKVSVLSGS